MKREDTSSEKLPMEVITRRHYDQALRNARLRRFHERLTGHSSSLVPFNYLQRVVEMTNQRYRGIQAVPISQIIGSLDRSGEPTDASAYHEDASISCHYLCSLGMCRLSPAGWLDGRGPPVESKKALSLDLEGRQQGFVKV